jgi:dTDP-4-amino-4,6-dideoxygalactose transaminase
MLTSWLKKEDILFVEDCAHAWLSDLLGGNCGRSGRFAFYSLHKLLPLSKGGILVDNKPVKDFIPFGLKYTNCFFDLNIDLFSIFEARRKNYRYLVGLLGDFDKIEILYKELPEGTCPQTMPIILKKVDRDKLYFEMNASGFGMVSLYHTMIKELNGFHSEAASVTSKNIINFPVHQDITKADYVEMIKILKSICYGI